MRPYMTSALVMAIFLINAPSARGDITSTCLQPVSSGRRICGFARMSGGVFYNHLKSTAYSTGDDLVVDRVEEVVKETALGTYDGWTAGAGIEMGIITESGIGFGPFAQFSPSTSVTRRDSLGPGVEVEHFAGGLLLTYYPGGVDNRFYLTTKYGMANIKSNFFSEPQNGLLLGASMGVDFFTRHYFQLGVQAEVLVMLASETRSGDISTHEIRQRLISPGLSLTVAFR